MIRTVAPGAVRGTIRVPASKSHTIRALLIASLARGTSRIVSPLDSADTRACLSACASLGAKIELVPDGLSITGVGGAVRTPENVIDVGNSGTTLYLAAGIASLQPNLAVFSGDAQIRRRQAAPLLASLRDLGARAESTRGNGCAPFIVGSGIKGGRTSIACTTSQYLSALLLCAPLARSDVEIEVSLLNERPYVDMTLDWLSRQGVELDRDGFDRFRIRGNQGYRAFDATIPGDYSSATFFLCAAAITGSTIRIEGLEPDDSQGDKAVLDVLERMGCAVVREVDAVELTGGTLEAGEFDLNATPDALPALAVTACFASGETRLINVPQAREKETDRISVMQREISALGGNVEELPDGLVVRGRRDFVFSGGVAAGHGDHRIVMALAIGALGAAGPVEIDSAEAVDVTFPGFFELLDKVRDA